MRGRRAAVVWGLLTLALVAVVVALVYRPPSFRSLLVEELPSSVAGEPVPTLSEPPLVRIAVAGDTGTGDAHQQATVEEMVDQGRGHPYDALLLLGDLIYEDGEASLTRSRVIEPFAPIIENGAELIPALGNHDYLSGQQQAILRKLGRQRPWYAERVGPLRVLVLDSNRVEDDAQTRWLERTLSSSPPSATWTIAAMHHPAYSAGHHGSDEAVRERWSELFARAEVPLVLAGHDHDYQRSTPQDGVTYVVSGAGAKQRRSGQEDFTAVSASTLHFLDLLVYDDRLVGRAIDQSGELVDLFTLDR